MLILGRRCSTPLNLTWSRGMSPMSGVLILSHRLKEVTNSLCFTLFLNFKKIVHLVATRCLIEMRFGSHCSIFKRQVIYIEKSKFNIADMWLIPLDRVTLIWRNWESLCVINPVGLSRLLLLPSSLLAFAGVTWIMTIYCSNFLFDTVVSFGCDRNFWKFIAIED